MKPNKNNLKNLEKFNKRIKFDSELIKRRFATTDKKHQLLLKNQIALGETTKRDRNIPNKIFHQMQIMQERVYLELGIQSLSNFPSFPPSLHLIPRYQQLMVCTLDNNLQLCGAMGAPRKLYQYSEDDPPEDLDEKFYFDNVTTDNEKKSYSFTLNSIFPLTPDYYTHTVAYFDFKFIFPIGSSGTYCFLPLTKFLGNISYFTSASSPGYFTIDISYGIIQNGELLGGGQGSYGVELDNNDQIPLNLSTDDFNYDRSIVDLDSEHLYAEIPVFFTLGFHNVYNDDGHFILDCASQGGELACDYIKWGKNRPLTLTFPNPLLIAEAKELWGRH